MASFWSDLLGGGTQLAGYGAMLDKVGDYKDDTATSISNMQDKVGGMTSFQPWGVRSGLGRTDYADGDLSMKLSDRQKGYYQQQGDGAADMFSRATMDPAQRESDIYERIRAMQRPGEQRGYDSMNAGMFGSGRGGMSTGAYGGSPEQHAFGLAQAEARNTASFGAMGQAQQEMQNYAGIGQQMFNNQYTPWQQMMGQAGMGSNQAELAQRGQLEGANMWSQLGLGGITADTNYSNIQGNAFGEMIKSLGQMGSGAGGALDSLDGGVWGAIQKWFEQEPT
jgi:hypothetical protein